MTNGDIKARVLEILNRNLPPWTFEGEEPFALELIAFVQSVAAPIQSGNEIKLWPDNAGEAHIHAHEYGQACNPECRIVTLDDVNIKIEPKITQP